MKTDGFLKYGLMDGLFYAWCASFTGFITSYFLKCGLSASALSTMLTVYMITCFAGALFRGDICDKLKTNRKVFLASFSDSDDHYRNHHNHYPCQCTSGNHALSAYGLHAVIIGLQS